MLGIVAQVLTHTSAEQGKKNFNNLEASLSYMVNSISTRTTKLEPIWIKQLNGNLEECHFSTLAFMISVTLSPCIVHLLSLITSFFIEPVLDALAQCQNIYRFLFSLKKVKGRELEFLRNLVWLAESSH